MVTDLKAARAGLKWEAQIVLFLGPGAQTQKAYQLGKAMTESKGPGVRRAIGRDGGNWERWGHL